MSCAMSCCPKGSAPYLAADHKDEGKVAETDGVQYYHVGSGPNGVLMIPDIWGWNGGRIRALADDMAKTHKLNVWIPKLLPKFEAGTDDDALPPDFNPAERFGELFEKGQLSPGGEGEWGPKAVIPKCKKVVEAMKKDGVSKYACVGFCYGGWIAMHLSKEIGGDELVCCASPHPSAVQLETGTKGDIKKLASAQKCPWAFYPCGTPGEAGGDPADYDSNGTVMTIIDGLFPSKSRSVRYKDNIHGFVTRGAIKSGHAAGQGDNVKAAVETCVEDIIDFLSDFGLVDGRVSMKVTTKKSLNFYVNSAKSFFTGVESKDGTKKDAVNYLKVSGLGDAVNVAVSAALTAEKEGLAIIQNIETSYPALQEKGQPRILIKLVKK